jgi:hypothetical protein
MHILRSRIAARLALAAGLAVLAAGAMAQSQQVQARVISTSPVTEANGSTSFNVTYEYDGRQYTTRTTTPPGATLPIEVNAYGVATMPVTPQTPLAPSAANDQARWQSVTPEPGVVVSAGAQQAPTYYPAPVYAQPVYTQPVYVQPAYAYPYAYAPAYFPPIGLSLNLGYSRGWGGHRGWR